MDKLKYVKLEREDGSYSPSIPISVEATYITMEDGDTIEEKMGKKPYYYNSVADMKADTKLDVGDMVVTLGYYEVNDGGASNYRIYNILSENEYGEELQNGLYAILVADDDHVYPEQFGAYGNNSADDADAIQACVDYANSKSLDIHFHGHKTYYVASSIQLRNNNRNVNGHRCLIRTNQDIAIFSMESGAVLRYCIIENLRIKGAMNSEYTNNIGIYVRGIYLTCRNIDIEHCYIGFKMDAAGVSGNLVGNRYMNMGIRYCSGYSMWLGAADNNKITDGWIHSCTFGGNVTSHLWIGACAGYKIDSVHTWGGGSTVFQLYNVGRTNISNIYIESFSSRCFGIHVVRDCNINNVTVKMRYDNTTFLYLTQSVQFRQRTVNVSNVFIDNNDLSDETEQQGLTIVGGENNRAVDVYLSNFNIALPKYTFKQASRPNITIHWTDEDSLPQMINANTIDYETYPTFRSYLLSLQSKKPYIYYLTGSASAFHFTDLPSGITTNGYMTIELLVGSMLTTSEINLFQHADANKAVYKGFYSNNTGDSSVTKWLPLQTGSVESTATTSV